jgi:hypothetical protein
VSSTNRGVERRPGDDYQTQPWVIDALLGVVKPSGRILEPCAGSGTLVRALAGFGKVEALDIDTAGSMPGTVQADFLTWRAPLHYDWTITNPPYSLACEFIDKALAISTHVAMLLRLNFLGSEERREWWPGREPNALYVLTPRPHFLDRDGKRVIGKNGKPGNDS